jgi:glycosyltransferase involved in cell wall biosynthesis
VKPKLSVVIASYNHQDYIAQTLKSLERQTFQDFEIIMVDDGSTDRTIQVARSTASRAQIVTQPNQGVVAARNHGMSLAKGEYICFIDSDDVVLPERFERQIAALDADPGLGLVFADALIIDSQGRQIGKFSDVYPVVPGDVAEMLVLHYCFTPMITVMVRMNVLKKTGPFEKPGPISDYMKWIEIANLSKTYYDPKPLGYWRRHQHSTSRQANKVKSYAKTRAALKRILNKYPQLQASIGGKIKRRFSRSYFLTAFWLAADGNISRARRYYYKAVKIYPASLENLTGLVLTYLPTKSLVVKLHRCIKSRMLPW